MFDVRIHSFHAIRLVGAKRKPFDECRKRSVNFLSYSPASASGSFRDEINIRSQYKFIEPETILIHPEIDVMLACVINLKDGALS